MRQSKFAALMCCAVLLGCSSDDSDKSAEVTLGLPYIGIVRADVVHYHPSFWEKWNETPVDLKMNFGIEVSHPGTLSELGYIGVYNSIADWGWDILGGSDNISFSDSYSDIHGSFRRNVFYANSPDRIELEGYEVNVFDSKGNRSTKRFDLSGFNGGSLDGKEYVYSAEYCLPPYSEETECEPPTFRGMKAMEAMTIERNQLSIESDSGSQSFTIAFTHRDSRAREYGIAFYGAGTAYQPLGNIVMDTPSIDSTPLISGRTTILNLPFSEILQENSEIQNIEEIGGIHIVLFDEFIDGWSSYLGFSEFVTLPAPTSE